MRVSMLLPLAVIWASAVVMATETSVANVRTKRDTGEQSEPVIFCYYSSFAQNRQGAGQFDPEDIDPGLCTHIIFAFADLVKGRYLKPSSWNDVTNGRDEGLYKRTQNLKLKNPNLKVLLAVGGWRIGSAPFVPMITNEENRKSFVRNAVRFLRRHGFDGLDMDWEFPGTRGSTPEDKYRFTQLMQELRTAFEREARQSAKARLLLTMAAAGGSYFINLAYEPEKIVQYVDYILLMTYNYHGSWNDFTGHHSGLFPRTDETGGEDEWNQAWTIDFWLNRAGAPKSKIVVGIATYGMTFTLADISDNGLKAAAIGGGDAGPYTGEKGILAYYEICKKLNDGWTSVWIDEQKVPYAHRGNQWVGYDNIDSVSYKANYIRDLGLGGAFIWSVEMDDFSGSCGMGRYPLLSTIAAILRQPPPRLTSPARTLRLPAPAAASSYDEYRPVAPMGPPSRRGPGGPLVAEYEDEYDYGQPSLYAGPPGVGGRGDGLNPGGRALNSAPARPLPFDSSELVSGRTPQPDIGDYGDGFSYGSQSRDNGPSYRENFKVVPGTGGREAPLDVEYSDNYYSDQGVNYGDRRVTEVRPTVYPTITPVQTYPPEPPRSPRRPSDVIDRHNGGGRHVYTDFGEEVKVVDIPPKRSDNRYTDGNSRSPNTRDGRVNSRDSFRGDDQNAFLASPGRDSVRGVRDADGSARDSFRNQGESFRNQGRSFRDENQGFRASSGADVVYGSSAAGGRTSNDFPVLAGRPANIDMADINMNPRPRDHTTYSTAGLGSANQNLRLYVDSDAAAAAAASDGQLLFPASPSRSFPDVTSSEELYRRAVTSLAKNGVLGASPEQYAEAEGDSPAVAQSWQYHTPGSACQRAGLFPHPTSCKQYFICVRHGNRWYKFHLTCPRGLGFKPDRAVCDRVSDCPDVGP